MDSKLKAGGISDEFWELIEPLIPERCRTHGKKYSRKPGGGRKPMDARKVFEAIIYVFRTGIQWKSLPKEKFGSPSSVHSYFKKWERAGLFEKIWKKGLSEYEDLQGIAWEWHRPIDRATITRAQNPVESRGIVNRHYRRRFWRPVIHRRNRRNDLLI